MIYASNFYGEDEILLSKTFARSKPKTFSIKPIREFIARYVFQGMTVVDPFAGNTTLGALDFLKSLGDESADVILCDPPVPVSHLYWSTFRDECQRILKREGHFLCFGEHTNGLGKKRGFWMQEVLIVNHGGCRPDTLCTAEVKM